MQGNAVAYGVTDTPGTLPALGETVVLLPVTVSAAGVARTIIDLMLSGGRPRIAYALRGKLGTAWGSVPFESRGTVDLARGERA